MVINQALDELESKTGRPARMMVLDPIGNFFGSADCYKDSEVRKLWMPLKQIAEKREVAIVLVGHHGKAQQTSAQHQALGSVGQGGIARAHWQIYIDRDDKELRYFAPCKVNDAVECKTVSYRVVKPDGRVEFVDTEIDRHADDFMRDQQLSVGRPSDEIQKAIDWLQEFLANGQKPVTEVFEVAKESEGIAKRTLERAKEKSGIKAKKVGTNWVWMLPENETPAEPELWRSCQERQNPKTQETLENKHLEWV